MHERDRRARCDADDDDNTTSTIGIEEAVFSIGMLPCILHKNAETKSNLRVTETGRVGVLDCEVCTCFILQRMPNKNVSYSEELL